jgi:hypothetical protein
VLTTSLLTEPNWLNVPTTTAPLGRYGSQVAYDGISTDKYVLMFGGCGPVCPTGDTDTFSGGSWTQLAPTPPQNVPQSYQQGIMTYDAHDGYVVYYGGIQSAYPDYATWTYSGGSWTNLGIVCTASNCPMWGTSGDTHGAVAVYDAADSYVVLFGTDRTTWKFAGGSWSQFSITCTSTNCPSTRWQSQMTYDSGDGYVLLFGGCTTNTCSAFDSDTWQFLAGTWSVPTGLTCYHSVCPTGRGGAGMAYDTADSYVTMFGGCGLNCPLGDTWSYTGGLWKQISITGTSPLPRFLAGMAYDANDGYVVLFSGETGNAWGTGGAVGGDTWTYVSGAWTRR